MPEPTAQNHPAGPPSSAAQPPAAPHPDPTQPPADLHVTDAEREEWLAGVQRPQQCGCESCTAAPDDVAALVAEVRRLRGQYGQVAGELADATMTMWHLEPGDRSDMPLRQRITTLVAELRAERDRQAGRVETLESIRDADTEELERQRSLAGQARAQRDAARRELEQAREALGSYAMGEGDMPVRDQQIRRDGAADALDWAAGIAKRIAGGEEVHRDLCIAAAEVRSGFRTIPTGGGDQP